VVVWWNWGLKSSCRTSLIVASPTADPWRLPGHVINISALGVSADGKQIAFDGTYKPPGGGQDDQLNGLFYADSKDHLVTQLSNSCGTTSISWSPDGGAFAYDCQSRVLIHEMHPAKSRPIAEGSNPDWSPDGRWIAFRSLWGRAQLIDPVTLITKSAMSGRNIEWGLHWSPDSRYLMAAKKVGLFEEMIHGVFDPLSDSPSKIVIWRLEDDSISDRLWFPVYGKDDRGYSWITNYQTFLKAASQPLEVKPCP
jgi:Tol biopolymer transport system component